MNTRRYKFNPARCVYWIGDVDETRLAETIKEIGALAQENKSPIFLLVRSTGGSPTAAFAFYDYIHHVLRREIITIASGEASSSGIILFLTGTKRIVTPSTIFQFHPTGLAREGDNVLRQEFASEVKYLDLVDNQFKKIAIVASGGKLDAKIIGLFDAEHHIVTANEALKLGLAHEIWDS